MEIGKLNEYRERLQAEKQRIEMDTENSNRFGLNESQRDAISELSSYDNHPADLGSETFEREKDLALWNNSKEIYHRINEALGRIEDGTYGRCEECGQEINYDRLEAVPYTSLCVTCRKEEDKQFINRERPVEEEVLSPPFGRTFLDDTDVVATDGEDIWQQVARYGTSESPSDLGGTNSYNDIFYDSDENQGMVEKEEGVIDVGPDDIPPDPDYIDEQN